MTAWDVLCWIAFGEAQSKNFDNHNIDFVGRWGNSRPEIVLRALEARASTEPHYLVQPLIMDGQPWDGKMYANHLASPKGPRILRRIRAQARRREGRLVTFQELPKLLKSDLEKIERDDGLLTKALATLREAVRGGKLAAWGCLALERGETDQCAEYVKLSPSVLFNDLVALTEWGTIGPDPDHPTAIFKYHGKRYRNVRFQTDEVLANWPPGSLLDQGLAPTRHLTPASPAAVKSAHRGGGRPIRIEWDVFWIELALWIESNGLNPLDRQRLQKHMLEWAAQQWPDPPHESTIREKVKLFYATAAKRR